MSSGPTELITCGEPANSTETTRPTPCGEARIGSAGCPIMVVWGYDRCAPCNAYGGELHPARVTPVDMPDADGSTAPKLVDPQNAVPFEMSGRNGLL